MELTRIISSMDDQTAQILAEEAVGLFPVRVLREPEPAMVMVRHTDPVEGTPFCLGELIVMECEVEIAGKLGFGCVAGNEPVKSFVSACVDAVEDSDSGAAESFLAMVRKEADAVIKREEEESSRIARTRVDFDVKKD